MPHSLQYLHNAESTDVHGVDQRHVLFFRIGCGIVSALTVWLVIFGFFLLRTSVAALDGRDALMRAKDAVLEMDFDKAAQEMNQASVLFDRAASGGAVLRSAGWIPWVGDRIRVSEGLLKSGREVVRALSRLVNVGAELVRLSGLSESEIQEAFDGASSSITFDTLPLETKRAILRRLSASADDFAFMHTSLVLAEAELDEMINESFFAPYVSALESWRTKLAELRPLVSTAAIAARLLPQFLGLDQEKETLLLFLNNAEMRPGGGFIGSYGVLAMKDGEIVTIRTEDAYHLDRPAGSLVKAIPPVPLQKYLQASRWFFRDANWSPDFAVSAKQAAELWNSEARLVPAVEQPRIFANVAGLTPTYISSLLKITGPLRVAGQTFTDLNMADRLEYQVEQGYAGQGIPEAQRKEILAELVRQLKEKLYALPLARWKEVLEATKEAFRTKQFALYSEDQLVEETLTAVGWGGRVLPKTQDVQMVADANLASLKSDPAISRFVRYEVFRNTDKQFVGRTTIRYEHHGQFDWKTTRYRTYARLFVPKGSKLVRTAGAFADDPLRNPSRTAGSADVVDDLNLTSFGAFTSVEPGEAQELVFEYLLAPDVVQSIADGHYRLSWIKQIGALAPALTLTLDFDKNVTFAAPSEAADAWGDDVYHLETSGGEDRVFAVEL